MNYRITVLTSLFRCERYLDAYLDALAALIQPEDVEILLLHNEPSNEELAIIRKKLPSIQAHVRHIIIPQREGLYTTWNRGVKESRGEYLAVWNVDDIRTPLSLVQQAASLDANPKAVLCYGSYCGIQHSGETIGTIYAFPEYTRFAFTRSCYLTPFPMWRKSIHHTIGYFDEGFRSAGDYDFQIRAAQAAPFVKLDALCGYYLEAPETGISKSGDINNIERTVCELRYGIFDKLNLIYVRKALGYSLGTLRWFGGQHALQTYFHSYFAHCIKRVALAPVALFRMPINILRFVKHRVLPRLGLFAQQPTTQPVHSLPIA